MHRRHPDHHPDDTARVDDTAHVAPSAQFVAQANAGPEQHLLAAELGHEFWACAARETLTWSRDFTRVLGAAGPDRWTWFEDGTLNAAYNAVDRHVAQGHGDRVAYHFEGEPGDRRDVTYRDLYEQSCRAANVLTGLGVGVGDRVAVYLPMIPEAVVAMLACARIGAPHVVVFAGFSADALRARIEDVGATVVVTADGGHRRGPLALKSVVDQALAGGAPTVRDVLVVRRTGAPVDWHPGRDVWWDEALAAVEPTHDPVPVPAEHPLFVLYTSGTTGRPKGVVHSTGGYLTQVAWAHRYVFDAKPAQDVYWCTADLGWIMGHSMAVYGPLVNGATQVLYEGAPDEPGPGRWWEVVERYGVSVLLTSPAAVRHAMRHGPEVPAARDLSSLRLLGVAGETISREAWHWFRDVVGGGVPVVDSWWQTETGAPMIGILPGAAAARPGAVRLPLPGIVVDVVDADGSPTPPGGAGELVVREPWPAMLRGLWGDEERHRAEYWSYLPGVYRTGDSARRDSHGDLWLLGRVDDVINVSGHRLSTVEIEAALASHPRVADAAVVAVPDELRGQAVAVFVVPRGGVPVGPGSTALEQELREHVARRIGAFARPRSVALVPELATTRSDKIVRRLLRDAVADEAFGDVTGLANVGALEHLRVRARQAVRD